MKFLATRSTAALLAGFAIAALLGSGLLAVVRYDLFLLDNSIETGEIDDRARLAVARLGDHAHCDEVPDEAFLLPQPADEVVLAGALGGDFGDPSDYQPIGAGAPITLTGPTWCFWNIEDDIVNLFVRLEDARSFEVGDCDIGESLARDTSCGDGKVGEFFALAPDHAHPGVLQFVVDYSQGIGIGPVVSGEGADSVVWEPAHLGPNGRRAVYAEWRSAYGLPAELVRTDALTFDVRIELERSPFLG